MAQSYSCYEFDIKPDKDKWIYVIYEPDYKPSDATILLESAEWFDTEFQAQMAAVGHISLLENGEG